MLISYKILVTKIQPSNFLHKIAWGSKKVLKRPLADLMPDVPPAKRQEPGTPSSAKSDPGPQRVPLSGI